MSTKRVKPKLVEPKLVEPIHELARPVTNSRYLVSKGAAGDLLERVLATHPGAVIKVTTEEMRLWREHVVAING